MEQSQRLTAIIERENNLYVSRCPELDIASQGASIEEARTNLIDALTLFFEVAGEEEIRRRMPNVEFVSNVEALEETKRFFALAERFRAATDETESERLGEELGQIIFRG